MTENLIFYFSGTGNNLKIAKDIKNIFKESKIIPMGSDNIFEFNNTYESIGFIYPTYFQGLPAKVYDYISKLNFPKEQKIYYYAVNTHGGTPGNGISQLNNILMKKGIKLNYAQSLRMFSNYVVLYNMSKNIEKSISNSKKKLIPIIENIKNKKETKIKKENPIMRLYYNHIIKAIHKKDKNFNISENCISCKICMKVCPVKNIKFDNDKPLFQNHCEQCMACIQYCPQKAVNYKKKTQKRRRYTNPEISYKELSEWNKNY